MTKRPRIRAEAVAACATATPFPSIALLLQGGGALGAYQAGVYQALAEHGIEPSMSRTGNCWDNAVTESFFSTAKRELTHHGSYATREEARRSLFESIEVFYNRQRLHSTLGYRSPAEFELRFAS